MKPLRFFFLSLTLASKPKPRHSVSDLNIPDAGCTDFYRVGGHGDIVAEKCSPAPQLPRSPAPRFPILPPDERGLQGQPVLEWLWLGLSFAIPRR